MSYKKNLVLIKSSDDSDILGCPDEKNQVGKWPNLFNKVTVAVIHLLGGDSTTNKVGDRELHCLNGVGTSSAVVMVPDLSRY